MVKRKVEGSPAQALVPALVARLAKGRSSYFVGQEENVAYLLDMLRRTVDKVPKVFNEMISCDLSRARATPCWYLALKELGRLHWFVKRCAKQLPARDGARLPL